LPSNWTTLYELSTLTDEDFAKVKKLLQPDVAYSKIAKALGKTNTPDPSWLLNFLNLEVDKRKVTVADFVKTLSAIKKDLKKYKVIKVVDDNKEKVQKSIERYINSLNKKKKKADKEAKKRENKRKTKEIIKNAA